MNINTKKQKNRKTEKQKNRKTEKQKNIKTKKQFFCFSVSSSFCSRQGREGFTALITVLIVSAITLTIAATTIFLSTSESLLSFSAAETHEAIQIADSCAEEALFRLKSNQIYSGGSITIGSGNCMVAITGSGGNGSARTIIATSTITTSIAGFTRVITASSTITTNTVGNATTTDIIRWRE